jgi:hypothetical protein
MFSGLCVVIVRHHYVGWVHPRFKEVCLTFQATDPIVHDQRPLEVWLQMPACQTTNWFKRELWFGSFPAQTQI